MSTAPNVATNVFEAAQIRRYGCKVTELQRAYGSMSQKDLHSSLIVLHTCAREVMADNRRHAAELLETASWIVGNLLRAS